MDIEAKQELLEETRVEQRVQMLLLRLDEFEPAVREETPPRKFPPDFSAN
jgi:hypothetical protein